MFNDFNRWHFPDPAEGASLSFFIISLDTWNTDPLFWDFITVQQNPSVKVAAMIITLTVIKKREYDLEILLLNCFRLYETTSI